MTNLPSPYEDDDDRDEELPLVSERSRTVALILGVLGGVFGFHRFYAGRIQTGIAMAVTFGGLGMWWLYDMVTIIAGEFRDVNDLPLRNWEVADSAPRQVARSRDVEALTQQMEDLQRQMGEMAERVDFAERLLTQQRERQRLTGGSS